MKRKSVPSEPSYEDLVAQLRQLPAGKIGQVVCGRLYVSNGGAPAHVHVVGELSATLLAGSPSGDPVPEGWTFLTQVELALPDEALVVADIAGWRAPHERIVALPTPIELVPPWICEVLDESSRALDLTCKRKAYAAAGVKTLWVVDPAAQVLEVFENVRGRWMLVEAVSENEIAAPPFDALRFDVADLFMPASRR
jgi:Putative restriction endonuclease